MGVVGSVVNGRQAAKNAECMWHRKVKGVYM